MERNLTLDRPQAAGREPIATHDVRGGGGLRLHAREWGNRRGRPILFIHGWSLSQLCWARQIDGPLAEEFHLVTFDNRGHGMSEKPLDADRYVDSQLWADDVAAVIDQARLDRPVVVAWSYGGLVVTDYLRVYGQDGIAGINMVGGAVMLKPPAFDHLGPGFLGNVEDASAPDLPTNIAAIQRFVRTLTTEALSEEDRGEALCSSMVVPAQVRGALVSREIDGDDVLSGLSMPVLLSHGRRDAMVLPSMAEHVSEICESAELSWYDHSGHMPFLEEPARFNRELGAFVRRANQT
jgi:non-heme chloroperoxidase